MPLTDRDDSGPTQDCGKTLVSTSLAAIEAQAGLRCYSLMRICAEGYVHNIFDLKNHSGLSDVLDGKCHFRAAIQRYEKGNIDVLTCGPVPLRPSELLMSERFQGVNDLADEHYDLVILDTPPVLAVTTPQWLLRWPPHSLLVARYGKTSLKEMENSIKRLQQTGRISTARRAERCGEISSAVLPCRLWPLREYGQRPAATARISASPAWQSNTPAEWRGSRPTGISRHFPAIV